MHARTPAVPLPAVRSLSAQVEELASAQAGVVGRAQLAALGVSRAYVRVQLRARRWQRAQPRTYVTFTGPMPFATRVWAAILYAGGGAVASHGTAAHLSGLTEVVPEEIEVTVTHGHRAAQRPGLRVRQSRLLASTRHPTLVPPQTRVEDTVLDLTEATRSEYVVIDVVLRSCQRRLTTPARLRDAAAARKRMRWRLLVTDLVGDVRDGVQSALERRYLRDVERSHRLPRGTRNAVEGRPGRRRYRDVRYLRWGVVVELDGRAAHPDEWKERDDLRDNEVLTEDGSRTLRYGWQAVTTDPCGTAAQVARLLRSNGWRGSITRCPSCPPDTR